MDRKIGTKQIVVMGMLAALGIVGALAMHLTIFPQVEFLKYDPADIPIMITTFAFGPLSGLMVTIVVSVCQGIFASKDGIIGIIMHILATGSFALVAGSIYNVTKTRKGAYLALVAGVVTMTATMAAWNLLITPLYTGAPRAVIIELMPYIVAFNIIKATINAFITALLYKRIHKLINSFTKRPY